MEFQLQLVAGESTKFHLFDAGLFIELTTDLLGLPPLWILGVM